MKHLSKLYLGLSILFVISLSSPMIKSFVEPASLISQLEKRSLSSWPQHQKSKSIESYFSGITNYVNDHFGFRNELIYLNHSIKYSLDESPAQNVTKGKSGWLFLSSVDALESNDKLSKEVEDIIIKRTAYIHQTRKYLSDKNIAYLFFVTPNKRSVYPEYLPRKYLQTDINKSYNLFIEKFNIGEINYSFDALKSLSTNKNNQYGYDLYFKNDSHWNQLGAHVISQEIIKNLEKNYPSYKIKTAPLLFTETKIRGGDLAKYISLDDELIAYEPSTVLPDCTKRSRIIKISKGVTLSKCNTNDLKVLFIGDSFMAQIYPFLSRSFGSFYMTRQGLRRRIMNQVIRETNPDIVIEEIVERNITKPIHY